MRLLVLLLLAGCADDLPAGSLLERTRVLAVAAHPAGDAARAWPRPGEETELSFLIAGPDETPPMTWTATLATTDAPFFSTQGTGHPELRFVAPEADAVYLLAEVVPYGEPETTVAMQLPIEKEAANHHPLPPEISWGAGCAGGKPVELAVKTRGADREPWTDDEGAAKRETLRLSFFATAGELDGQFRVVEADDPDDTTVKMKWTPPEMPGGDVRFTVVARDLRGGVAWTQRTLCANE